MTDVFAKMPQSRSDQLEQELIEGIRELGRDMSRERVVENFLRFSGRRLIERPSNSGS